MDVETMPRDETLYQELILERARAPRNGIPLACFDAQAEGNNPMCGDRLRLQVKHDADGTIEAVGFDARGCAISVASADLMADSVRGLSDQDARRLWARFAEMVSTGDIPAGREFDQLGALAGVHEFRSRMRCATLAWSALERALLGDER